MLSGIEAEALERRVANLERELAATVDALTDAQDQQVQAEQALELETARIIRALEAEREAGSTAEALNVMRKILEGLA